MTPEQLAEFWGCHRPTKQPPPEITDEEIQRHMAALSELKDQMCACAEYGVAQAVREAHKELENFFLLRMGKAILMDTNGGGHG